jgi:general secretion pathway protein M
MALVMTPRQSRAAAMALLLGAVVFVLGAFIIPVYLLHRHYDFYLDKYSDELARYQRIAATRATLEAKLAAVKAREPRKGFLKNASPGLAASEVQDVVKSLIEGNGGRLAVLQISPHKDDGRFRQASVNVQMSASVPALRKILHALESAQPHLFVDSLTVRSNVGYGYRPVPVPVPGLVPVPGVPVPGPEPEILFVQMDVSGFAVAGS